MKNISTNYKEYIENSKKANENPENFWEEVAENFKWRKKWTTVLEKDMINAHNKWFLGAKLNITENCLDRHLEENGDKTAIIWEPNENWKYPIHITYRELHKRVCEFANVLKSHGVKKNSRVCIYLPMIPEVAYAMLACARLGAVHSVVFAGFSAKSLHDRIVDSAAIIVITSDWLNRGPKKLNLKEITDQALEYGTPTIKKVLVVKNGDEKVNFNPNIDLWLHDELAKVDSNCPPEIIDAEDPLFILYTSGSTGKPKGIQHSSAGYMVYSEYSFRNVFQYKKDDIYWCTADAGWITGHTYIVYGPLLAGATTVMFEGIPTFPNAGRFWQICDKLKVNIFYTAPTAIRMLMASGLEFVKPYKLNTLKTLGSVGEPINEEAWLWYKKNIGKDKCPIVDTWWQTETGGIMISSLSGVTDEKPCHAAYCLPGINAVLLDKDGKELTENDVEGLLCIKEPWPSIVRTIWGDHERFLQTYFSNFKGYYFTGDGAKRDKNGLIRIIGRVDDVINVSGHRFGTAEIECAINTTKDVVESAVVGYPHDLKGQGIYAYVICEKMPKDDEISKKQNEIFESVKKEIGPIAKPDIIQFVPGLPKTRSGKIMRRILRKIAENDMSNLGDISTLLDPSIVEEIKNGRQQ